MAGSGGKWLWAGIKFVIFLVICGGAWYGWRIYSDDAAQRAEISRARALFAQGHHAEAIGQFEAMMAKWPGQRAVLAEDVVRSCVAVGHQRYERAIQENGGYDLAAEMFEKARQHGSLAGDYLEELCDCYIEMGALDKARDVLAEVDRRDDVQKARFLIMKKRIEKMAGG